MVYIAYYTDLNWQICKYAQKRRICRKNSKYVFDKNLYAHFCPRRKAANLRHPVLISTLLNQSLTTSELNLKTRLHGGSFRNSFAVDSRVLRKLIKLKGLAKKIQKENEKRELSKVTYLKCLQPKEVPRFLLTNRFRQNIFSFLLFRHSTDTFTIAVPLWGGQLFQKLISNENFFARSQGGQAGL